MNFMFPLGVYLTITQGYKSSHVGNDYGWSSKVAGANNQPIVAAEAGTVVTAVDGYGNTYPNNRIYGNYVIVSHGDGWYTLYGHLLKGLAVAKGAKVSKGQTIGYMGNSGYSCGQHLHFELRKGGNSKSYAVDPLDYLTVQNGLVISATTLYPERIKKGVPTGYVGSPVAVDSTADQVEILIDTLRARKRPEMNDAVILGLANKGVYNVLEQRDMTHEASNGYLWYRVEDEMWVATKDGEWTKFTKGVPVYPDERDKKIAELEIENKQLKAEVVKLNSIIAGQNGEIEVLNGKIKAAQAALA